MQLRTDDPPPAPATALVVVAHHRLRSLTAHVADLVDERLTASGWQVDVLNLQAEGFDPRMTVEDQPDWANRDKRYSDEVHAHMDRIRAARIVVPVFPVYWSSVPALLKGWIDRVWNYGIAYGRSTPPLAGRRVLWLALAGAGPDDPAVGPMREVLERQLSDGIAHYCGFAESRVEILFESEGEPQLTDANGTLVIGDPLSETARDAHFAALERAAVDAVDRFAGSTAPAPVAG
jgi:putative NADPH-quinone reductase